MAAVRNACVIGALTVPLLASAGGGQIDSFGSGAASVLEGSTVDFFASFSVLTSTFTDGGSDLVEPQPVEGQQTWLLNWYRSEQETLREVHLFAGGFSTTDAPVLAPGSSYSGSWSFSIPYPSAGQFAVTLSGSWQSDVQVYQSSEMATRECMNVDPGGSNALACSSWQFTYGDYSETYSSGGSFASQTLNIEVTDAPVPELSNAMMWLAGLALLLGRTGVTRKWGLLRGRLQTWPGLERRRPAQASSARPARREAALAGSGTGSLMERPR